MKKFEVLDVTTGEVLPSSTNDACKAMTRLESLRKQRAFLIKRLGVFRVACVTLRVRKQRAEAKANRLQKENEAKSDCWVSLLFEENERLKAEIAFVTEWKQKLARQLDAAHYTIDKLVDERAKLSRRLHDCRVDRREWQTKADRCFAAAMKNAVKLYDAIHGEKTNALANERKGKTGE